jgi:hypothetical protein
VQYQWTQITQEEKTPIFLEQWPHPLPIQKKRTIWFCWSNQSNRINSASLAGPISVIFAKVPHVMLLLHNNKVEYKTSEFVETPSKLK